MWVYLLRKAPMFPSLGYWKITKSILQKLANLFRPVSHVFPSLDYPDSPDFHVSLFPQFQCPISMTTRIPKHFFFVSTFEAYFNPRGNVYFHWCHLVILWFVLHLVNQLIQKYWTVIAKLKNTSVKNGKKTPELFSKCLHHGGERGPQNMARSGYPRGYTRYNRGK